MSDITVEFHCLFCPNSHKETIRLPEGWAHRYAGIDEEQNAFCPDHSIIAEFAEKQCPGCVGGWGDCDLHSTFAYSHRRRLTEDDFAQLRAGICPKRTNGTFSVQAGEIVEENISEKAKDEAGTALANAIHEYWARYPESA